MFKKLIKFLREVKLELRKVSWPSRKEISGSTGVVIVSIIIMSIYLGILDLVFQRIMTMHLDDGWFWFALVALASILGGSAVAWKGGFREIFRS